MAPRVLGPSLEFRLPLETGPFRVLRVLGSGAMGTVYEAEELSSHRHVALKVLPTYRLESEIARERFEREARLAAAISHPSVVFVYGVHQIEGSPAISMELMSGETLADHLMRDPPPEIHRVVRWILQVIDGLEAAHRAGVLHRDVKPANCFLTADGRAKVGDFGLARSQTGGSDLTRAGVFIGTPLYASPEQARGRPLDVRSDIYSVGATLYALLTGVPAFHGGDADETLARILSEEPEDPRAMRPDLPRELVRAVLRAMAKSAGERFADYAEMRRALAPFADEARATMAPSTLSDLPEQIRRAAQGALDRFEILSVVGSTPSGRLLCARDADLAREVWIHLLSPLAGRRAAAPAAREEKGPLEAFYPRLIRSERAGRSPYDVYEALGGTTLEKAILQRAFVRWDSVHPLLAQLAEYCAHTPQPIHAEQLWIDHNGRLRVLPFPLAALPKPKREPLELLAHVLRSTLGSASHPGAFEGIPAAACALLEPLLAADPARATSVARIHEGLSSPGASARTLDVGRRLAQMLCAGLGVALAALAGARWQSATAADGAGLWRFPSLGELAAQPAAAATAVLWAALASLAVAALLRGAPSLEILGLGVRASGGRPANVRTALARSGLTWAPAVAAAAVVRFAPSFAAITVSLACIACAIQAVTAIRNPALSLADRIAGTRVVPR